MDRREFIQTVGAGTALVAGLPSSATAKGSEEEDQGRRERPNIVFIMVDDMGWANLGCYGGNTIATPNIDRMAEEGMRFTDAYSGCTVCAPARSCLMTGTHMGHTSVRLNTGGVSLLDEDTTVGELLKDTGYVTGGFGKWGLGDLDTPGVPEKKGFDLFYGYYHQIHAHYYLPDYLIRNGVKEPLPGNKGFYDKFRHGKDSGPFPRTDPDTGQERQFTADLIFDETLKFIRNNKDRPFFCYCPWTPPHGEYVIPEDDPAWQMYKDEEWSMVARVVAAYDGMLDRHVGRVLDLLEELGIDEKTIVFFCSDNGADRRFDESHESSGPLKAQKRSMHDGGIRIPFIVRWPGKIKPGQESDHLCYFPDMLPTFTELAGARTPEDIDGLSIVPALLGRRAAGRKQEDHDYLYWEWHHYNWGKQALEPNGLKQAARKGDWKAVRHKSNLPVQIYDLSKDLGEERDLAQERPEILADMERILVEGRTEMRPQAEPEQTNARRYR